MGANNVNTTSRIIKSSDEVKPYELGSFITNDDANQTIEMKNVATLNERGLNGNVDPVLIEVKKLFSQMQQLENKITNIESNGTQNRDLDKQIVEALKDLKNYSSFFEQATFQMETKVLKTSLSIAQKIIGIEISDKSTEIAKETIINIMSKIKTASKISIHLSPKDFLIIKDQINFDNHVSLTEDANVTPGGVVIASDLGNFDGNIESKVQTMMESLDAVL